ncbi:hypothetical protein F2Q70_00037303 [Brassica cretica]|uniref:Uncharacterized protein n=1 Tax=Brassica cretica TaxID=69181 RepID=A0A8S9JQX3_BRACR|nr:hypothetical protein F2Q70_00037303 [Brassica cretica]KAF3534891.1 hypothetical protein DY000_02043013 [Brassica cretica]
MIHNLIVYCFRDSVELQSRDLKLSLLLSRSLLLIVFFFFLDCESGRCNNFLIHTEVKRNVSLASGLET